MKIRLTDGAEYEGAPVEILEAMKSGTMFTQDMALNDYIAFLVENARKFQGKELAIAGAATEERAASLIDAFLATGMAEDIA